MAVIAFLPWVNIAVDMQLGRFKLRGHNPIGSDDPHAEFARRFVTLSAPTDDSDMPLLNPTKWVTVIEAADSGDIRNLKKELDVLRETIAFAAARERHLFSDVGSIQYTNSDHFELVVTSQPNESQFVRRTQRIDGHQTTLYADNPGSVAPEHVHPVCLTNLCPDFCAKLYDRCLQAPELLDGIRLFNQAMSDAPTVSIETKLVLLVAAIQSILEMPKNKVHAIANCFADALAQCAAPRKERTDIERPIDSEAAKNVKDLRALWFWDLYRTRGNAAHGVDPALKNFYWNPREHVLVGSQAVPILIESRLSQTRTRQESRRLIEDLAVFDYRLCVPNLFVDKREGKDWPWVAAAGAARKDLRGDREYWQLFEADGHG